MAPSPSGKARVCKTLTHQFDSGWCLHMPVWRNGRRKGLKILREEIPVSVRVRPPAPKTQYLMFLNYLLSTLAVVYWVIFFDEYMPSLTTKIDNYLLNKY